MAKKKRKKRIFSKYHFKAFPEWTKAAIAYRFLYMMIPPSLSKRLLKNLRKAQVYPIINLPENIELPPGITITPETLVPGDWKPGDPLPEGIEELIKDMLPEDWQPGDPLPYELQINLPDSVWENIENTVGGAPGKDQIEFSGPVAPTFNETFSAGPPHGSYSPPAESEGTLIAPCLEVYTKSATGEFMWSDFLDMGGDVTTVRNGGADTEKQSNLVEAYAAGDMGPCTLSCSWWWFDLSDLPEGATVLTAHFRYYPYTNHTCSLFVALGGQGAQGSDPNWKSRGSNISEDDTTQLANNFFMNFNTTGKNYIAANAGGEARLYVGSLSYDAWGFEPLPHDTTYRTGIYLEGSEDAIKRPALVITYE